MANIIDSGGAGGAAMSPDEYYQMLEDFKIGLDRSLTDNSMNDADATNIIASSMAGIFGMPYQFSDIVDPVIGSEAITSAKLGRKFNEKIFSIAPVLFLSPGEPKFMEGYNGDQKKYIASRLLADDNDDTTDASNFDDGRFYSFESNFVEYKKYANVALRSLALFMGIENVEVPIPGNDGTIKLGNIDIESFLNKSFTKYFGTQVVVPFFLDAANSISESYSNSTTESSIAQTVNGFSTAAKEVQFLTGGSDKSAVSSIVSSARDSLTNIAESVVNGITDALANNSVISRLGNELSTIVYGGKIVFPEIWSDSEFNKSYSINIKLRSPDPDPVSIFLNIYLPIILLISMAAPRQIGNSSNSFKSPFLVRATYKSIFNCDLGIITSLNIEKGGEDKWNVLGQPTSVDVSLEISDLYSTMFISKRMGLISNTAQLDYLSTLAGIDLNEYEADRMIRLWAQILGDTARDWASDFWGGIKTKLNRASAKVLNIFSDTRFLS